MPDSGGSCGGRAALPTPPMACHFHATACYVLKIEVTPFTTALATVRVVMCPPSGPLRLQPARSRGRPEPMGQSRAGLKAGVCSERFSLSFPVGRTPHDTPFESARTPR